MTTKTIFFDVYQTLLNVDGDNEKANTKAAFEQVLIPYLQQKGIAEADASQLQSHYADETQAFYKDHDKAQYHHSFSVILSEIFDKYYGVTIPEQELSDLIYAFRKISRGSLKIYEGVPEMLAALSTKYTLIIASYTQRAFTERELEEVGIRKYFAHCVYSSDIGFKKTSNMFWKKCLEVANCQPQDCAMVGDHPYEDMFMAHQNGIHTVWIMNPLTKE